MSTPSHPMNPPDGTELPEGFSRVETHSERPPGIMDDPRQNNRDPHAQYSQPRHDVPGNARLPINVWGFIGLALAILAFAAGTANTAMLLWPADSDDINSYYGLVDAVKWLGAGFLLFGLICGVLGLLSSKRSRYRSLSWIVIGISTYQLLSVLVQAALVANAY